MKKKTKFCIYCGKREANERDHVPPKCFFVKPFPSDLITVPCCSQCNREYGKIDEYMRNILISLETTETIPELEQNRQKFRRSFSRKESERLLLKIGSRIKPIDIYSKGGIYLGQKPAFDLNNEDADKFFERIARAFLFIENDLEYFKANINWKKSFDEETFNNLPTEMKLLLKRGFKKSLGNGLVKYIGLWWEEKITSLWFINFYGGVEFMIHVKASE